MRLIKLFNVAILCLGLTMVSCADGEDGIDGIDGINGVNGEDGMDGEDGADGTEGQNGLNGVSYDKLAKYGQIVVNMEGTRPDGIPFQDSATYKFTAIEASTIQNYNSVSVLDNIHSFKIRRFLSTPDDVYQTSYIGMQFEVENLGEASQQYGFLTLNILGYTVIGEDYKFFYLDGEDFILIDDTMIQNLVFNDVSNHLTYDFSVTIPAGQNTSGNDVTLSGTVDVIVLEEVETP